MTPFLLKVDRVASVEEAGTLAALGVHEMTFSPRGLVGGPEDDRGVTSQEAHRMMLCTPQVRWGMFVAGGLPDPSTMQSLLLPGVHFVQSRHLDLAQKVTQGVNLEFVTSDISADHDEDPAWTEARLEEARQQGAARFVVQVYPTVQDGWAQALEPTNPFDELKESDLRPLAARFPVIVEADFRPEHLWELRGGLYLGANFTLSPWQRTFGEVTQLLDSYRRQFSP